MFEMEEKEVTEQEKDQDATIEESGNNSNENTEESVTGTEEDGNEADSLENEEDINPLEGFMETLKQENKDLSEENFKFKNENETLKDRLARTTAEYDNFRKRTAKEKEGIYTDACEDILKQMLPVIDNLERAMTVGGNVEDLKKGLEMTIRQFNTSLERLNVEEISASGEFNPHFHNAVMHIDDEQYGKNEIVEVFQKGYKRGDKVLRYSMVKVAN